MVRKTAGNTTLESYNKRKDTGIKTAPQTPVTYVNESGVKKYQEKMDNQKKMYDDFKVRNAKISADIDNTKNDWDYINAQQAKRKNVKEMNEKMKEYLMENYGYNGVKPSMQKFIENIEEEVGHNFHIVQHEDGSITTVQDENSWERINSVLPFLKPLNTALSKGLKEVSGIDIDANDISKKVSDAVGTKGLTKEEMEKKKADIEAKNDKLNSRYVAEKVLGQKEGEGILDLFRAPKQEYTKSAQKALKDYGDKKITGLRVIRAPIVSALNKVLDVLTFNNWSNKLEKYQFDQLYHLGLQIEFDNKGHTSSIICEKNATINVSTNISNYKKDSQTMEVPLKGKSITINELLNNALQKVGKEQFFLYSAHSNNCQSFVIFLLESSGLLDSKIKDFVLQDLTELFKELPKYLPVVMNAVTDLGSRATHAFGGNKKTVPKTKQGILNELQKLKKSQLEEIYRSF
jgi:hypothetical protein